MPDLIYTDDEARGVPYTYLGPVGVDLPPARPAAYGVFLLLIVVGAFLSWLVAPSLLLVLVGIVLTPLPAAVLTRMLMGRVDYYRPVRFWLSMFRSELDAPRPLATRRRETATSFDATLFHGKDHDA